MEFCFQLDTLAGIGGDYERINRNYERLHCVKAFEANRVFEVWRFFWNSLLELIFPNCHELLEFALAAYPRFYLTYLLIKTSIHDFSKRVVDSLPNFLWVSFYISVLFDKDCFRTRKLLNLWCEDSFVHVLDWSFIALSKISSTELSVWYFSK